MRLLRAVTPVLALLLAACPHSAKTVHTGGDGKGTGVEPGGGEQALPLWSEIRTGKLSNGLTYYVLPHARPQERAYMWLTVHAGAVQEDEDQLGLAHFVEHMAFNGTKHFEHQQIVNYIESIGMNFGADLNAGTWADHTIYKLMVPTEDPAIVGKGMDILRDWAGDITFDPDELEAERGVVLSEWREGLGAYDRVWDKQAPVMFHDTRYAERNPIGKPEILKTATRDQLVRFYDDWYRPDMMAVMVVGEIDPDEIVKQIEAKFGDLENPAKPRAEIHGGSPPADGQRISIVTDPELPSASVQILNLFAHRQENRKSDYRRFMLDALYTRMLNDRLDEIAQRPDAPFTFAGGSVGNQVDEIEAFSRYAQVKEGRLDDALQALFAEVLRVERHGFTQTELERAKKAQLRGMHQSATDIMLADGFELIDELTRVFLEGELDIGREEEARLGDELIPGITLEELAKLGATYGGDENRVVLITGPSSMKTPTEQHVQELIAGVEQQQLDPYVDAADKPLLDSQPTPGTIAKEETRADGGVTWTLSNGAKVVVKETDFEADTILFQGFSPGGTAQATDKQWPSARYAADVISGGGAGSHSDLELDRILSGTVASVGVWIGETEEGVYGSTSIQDLEVMLQQAWLRITAPRKDEQAFEVWKQASSEWAAHRRVMPENAFYEDVDKILTGGHKRRLPAEQADIDKVDLDQALAFYQDRFGDVTDFTFVFVGNVDTEELKPLVEKYLASLPGGGRVEKQKDIGVKRPKGVTKKRIELGQEPKSSVYLTFFGDQKKWTREDATNLQILAQVLDITLREIMREKMSGVYGVGVWGWVQRIPHPERVFQIQFTCAPESVEPLEKAMFDEFARVAKDGASDEILAKLTETTKRNHEGNLIDNRAWASWLSESYRYGDSLETVMDVDYDLKRIDNKLIKAAAKKFLDQKQYVLGELFPVKTEK